MTLTDDTRTISARNKYERAVEMYASTNMSIRKIAQNCGVTPSALSAHICRHHRHLLLSRYGLDATSADAGTVKVKSTSGQSQTTYLKYKDAIAACQDSAYIEYNISQIARMFNLDGSALAAQLRYHYPGVIPEREKLRKRLGVADNTHRGATDWSKAAYEEATTLYRDTDMTIPEVARKCGVSFSGLSQYMRFYHQDVVHAKANKRNASRRKTGSRVPGQLSGTGALYGPRPETVAKYAMALALYRNTSLTIPQISEQTGVSRAGFAGYLHQWHRGDKLRRRGQKWDGHTEPDLQSTPKYRPLAARKYADAISSLKQHPRHVAEVAKEFGLHPEVFREYLRTHEPDLANAQGMMQRPDGRRTKRSSAAKYAAAIEEFATTAEPLMSIARRHGIVYNSLFGYLSRNCPTEIERHKQIIANQSYSHSIPIET